MNIIDTAVASYRYLIVWFAAVLGLTAIAGRPDAAIAGLIGFAGGIAVFGIVGYLVVVASRIRTAYVARKSPCRHQMPSNGARHRGSAPVTW